MYKDNAGQSKCRAPLQEKKLKVLALWWAIVIGPQLSLLTEASKARPASQPSLPVAKLRTARQDN
jgi:hypothetical protein